MSLRIFVFRLCLLLLTPFTSAQETPAPFKLSIVPSRSSAAERTITLADDKPDTFHVILTNTSGRDLAAMVQLGLLDDLV